jgi:hypothetical protein
MGRLLDAYLDSFPLGLSHQIYSSILLSLDPSPALPVNREGAKMLLEQVSPAGGGDLEGV